MKSTLNALTTVLTKIMYVDNYKIGCQDIKRELEDTEAEEFLDGKICLFDSKDECNKVPCTEEGLKRAGSIKHTAIMWQKCMIL